MPVRPLTPLPDEQYPRKVSKRPLGKGYWLAYSLATLVQAITPLALLVPRTQGAANRIVR